MTKKKTKNTWENRAMVEAIVAWVTSDLDSHTESCQEHSPEEYLTQCKSADAWRAETEGFWEALQDDPVGLAKRIQCPDALYPPLWSARERWSEAETGDSWGGDPWDNARDIALNLHGAQIANDLSHRKLAALYVQADEVFASVLERLAETKQSSDD